MAKTQIEIDFAKLHSLLFDASAFDTFREHVLKAPHPPARRTKVQWLADVNRGHGIKRVMPAYADWLVAVTSTVLNKDVQYWQFLTKHGEPYAGPAGNCETVNALRIAGIPIPNITVLRWFGSPTSTEAVCCTFSDAAKPSEIPIGWGSTSIKAYQQFKKERIRQARQREKQGQRGVYKNDLLAGVLHFSPDRGQNPQTGRRQGSVILGLKKVWFYQFDFIKACLAGAITEGNPIAGQRPRPPDPKFHKYPDIPFRIGVGSVVITADDFVVVPLRSDKVVLGEPGYAVSVGEGMTAFDLDNEQPCIGATCTRSLKDELGLQVGRDYDRADVKVLGLLFDWQICEPFFAMLVKVNRDFEEIKADCWPFAEDNWEHADLLKIPWTPKYAKMLIAGQLIAGRRQFYAASLRERTAYGMAYQATLSNERP